MKRVRLPGWFYWLLLVWLSCVVLPTRNGKMRLNLLVTVISWTYGVFGLDVGLWLWARQTYSVYWDPWQLLGACCTALLFSLFGLLFGAFSGQWCYKFERIVEQIPSVPSRDVYPVDPRRNSEKVASPVRAEPKTVVRPVWWRIVIMLASCGWAGMCSGRNLLGVVRTPRMDLNTLEVTAEPVVGWVAVPLGDGFEVDLPGRPERQGDWMVFESADGRFGASSVALRQDESVWRWRLWGGMLYQVGPFHSLRACRQAGLDGIEFRNGDLISRTYVGPTRLYSVCVLTRPGNRSAAACLNSLRTTSK